MRDLTYAEAVPMSQELTRILESPAFNKAVDLLREDLIDQIVGSQLHQKDTREAAYVLHVALAALVNKMQSLVSYADGLILQQEMTLEPETDE